MPVRNEAPDPRTREFCPRLLEVAERPPSPLPRALLLLLLALLGAGLIWAAIGRLDVIARAEGKLVPKTRLKIVQPFEGGRVASILVKEGDTVAAGETLILMDQHLHQADTRKLEAEFHAARLQLRRVEAELAGEDLRRAPADDPDTFARVWDQYRAHRSDFENALAGQQAVEDHARQQLAAAREIGDKLQQVLPIYRERESAVASLQRKGYVPELELLERRQARIEAEQDLEAQRHTMESLQAKIREAKERRESIRSAYRRELLDQRVDLNKRIAQLQEERNKHRYREELMALKAPQSGVVKELATHTEGSVVPSGTVLMRLVPSGESLVAEVLLENRDVGFVAVGQSGRVKLASYDFQKYGTLDGTVVRVSADAESARDRDSGGEGGALAYRTVLSLGRQHLERAGRRFELRPGMRVSAEIKLGERTVLEYLLSPIRKAVSEAGTER